MAISHKLWYNIVMRIDILTLFPNMFSAILNESILKRAQEKDLIEINTHNIRDFATDAHKTVDDTPYGGGTGMVLRVDVIDKALSSVILTGSTSLTVKLSNSRSLSSAKNLDVEDPFQARDDKTKPVIILLTPQGEQFSAKMATTLAKTDWIILICGHYEGFDERVRQYLVDKQISIGNYVLTGGELPAMVLVDAISRFVPGVLPDGAPQEDSFSLESNAKTALEYPHYTRPEEYNGWKVPKVLLSGNHAEIAKWRKNNLRTQQ